MKRFIYVLLGLTIFSQVAFSQGLGIPSKRGGLGFGNLKRFTGIRFNFIDRNIEKIVGINTTVWNAKNSDQQTGDIVGLSIGLPMAMGAENQSGVSIGIFGVGAKHNITGLNIGGIGVGAGGSVRGFNFAGIGIGAGKDLVGVNLAVLGCGAGGDVKGINIGGLGIGSGGKLVGFNLGLAGGIGAGDDVTGINIGGLGVGAGSDLTGFNFALAGIGAGGRVRGLNIAGLGMGSGESLSGISIAGLAAGSVNVNGLAVAAVVGGMNVKGIILAPAWMRIGDGKLKPKDGDGEGQDGTFTGFGVSAYNRIKGKQTGVTIGVVNYTKSIRGVQFGLINIVKENPKGLRVLPFFNTRFGKKGG